MICPSYLSAHTMWGCSPVLRHFHIVQINLWKTQYIVFDFWSRMTKLLSIIGFRNNSWFVNICKYDSFLFPLLWKPFPPFGRGQWVCIKCSGRIVSVICNERSTKFSHVRFKTKICLTSFVNKYIVYLWWQDFNLINILCTVYEWKGIVLLSMLYPFIILWIFPSLQFGVEGRHLC